MQFLRFGFKCLLSNELMIKKLQKVVKNGTFFSKINIQ